jgi:hypothetical protein
LASGVRGGVLTSVTPALAKISSKALVNLASRSRMRKRKAVVRVAEVHEQVAGLLGGPGAVRVGGHAEDVHVAGRDLHDEQDVQAFEEDRVDAEEVTGQRDPAPNLLIEPNRRSQPLRLVLKRYRLRPARRPAASDGRQP